ncbi:hypothetical protein AAC387_Pa11g0628 [Persea americana]
MAIVFSTILIQKSSNKASITPTDTILAGQSLILRSGQDLSCSGQDLLSSSVSTTNHTIGRFILTLNRDYGLSLNRDDDDSSFYWRLL